MGEQCKRSESSAMDSYHVQNSMNRGNQKSIVNMPFEDGLRSLKAEFDYIILKVRLDNIMHLIKQKRNVNTFNSNCVICNLCRGCHASYTCMQVQNMDYYDEFGHYDSCFINATLIGVILMIMVGIINVHIVILHICMLISNPILSNMNLIYHGN